jgi:hypothetical protein
MQLRCELLGNEQTHHVTQDVGGAVPASTARNPLGSSPDAFDFRQHLALRAFQHRAKAYIESHSVLQTA